MNETAEELWNKGTYLITIEYYGYKVSLYSLYAEFYEVFYNSFENRIDKIILATEEDFEEIPE